MLKVSKPESNKKDKAIETLFLFQKNALYSLFRKKKKRIQIYSKKNRKLLKIDDGKIFEFINSRNWRDFPQSQIEGN